MVSQELKEIEKQDGHLFHGSGKIVEEFEPRQAYTVVKTGEKIKDGRPAIFASPSVDYAIFMAIVNKSNCPRGLRSGCGGYGKLRFTATKDTLEQLNKDSSGYVYIFNRSDFEKRNEGEWVSYEKIKPLRMVEVKWSDFTPDIEMI